jgi:uncharacterized damage-inducible protein DinB
MAASLAVFEEFYGDLLALTSVLDEAALNWQPPVPDTNSIAALVQHVIGSNAAWLARATGEELQRDREAEFRSYATPAVLRAAIEQSRAEVQRRFALLANLDPLTPRTVRRLDAPDAAQVSAAWCVAHALIHTGEHWGQIQLNRQLHAADTTMKFDG